MVVEVLNEGRPAQPGESGEIVLTSLHAWASPLIRYAPGDMAEHSTERCACGANCSTLSKVHGRTHDHFSCRRAAPCTPETPLLGRSGPSCVSFTLYQIAQVAPDLVTVTAQLMPGAEMPSEKLETVRKGVSRHLGEGITVVVSVVDQIPCGTERQVPAVPLLCHGGGLRMISPLVRDLNETVICGRGRSGAATRGPLRCHARRDVSGSGKSRRQGASCDYQF